MLPPSVDERWAMPPRRLDASGAERRVGIELEFGGMDVTQACAVITNLWGGRASLKHRFEGEVDGTELGDFSVCADAWVLKERAYLEWIEKAGLLSHPEVERTLDESASALASLVVPIEISCPPVALSLMPELERLREALRLRQARGTDQSLLYAFGLHINPEAPGLDAAAIWDYLRAYLLLEPILWEGGKVDMTRRVLPFVSEFPAGYVHEVLRPEYRPGFPDLVRDYIRWNPTRNRSLDMLPLLAHVEHDLVFSSLPQEKIKPRPAFHFRLPNCQVSQPEWRIAEGWRLWLGVERLAADRRAGDRLVARLAMEEDAYTALRSKPWKNTLLQWLDGTADLSSW